MLPKLPIRMAMLKGMRMGRLMRCQLLCVARIAFTDLCDQVVKVEQKTISVHGGKVDGKTENDWHE